MPQVFFVTALQFTWGKIGKVSGRMEDIGLQTE
jgi:hypothetical protein